MDLKTLEIQNPWWIGQQDFHLQQLQKQKYQYHPDIIPLSELLSEKSGIYTLIGPRQVGKTTYLKQLIQELLHYHQPQELFYFSCENMVKEQLREVILFFMEKISSTAKQYLFLDEVSLVEDWEMIELELYNKGLLQNTIIINSGSSSLNLKKSAERLPGRKNKGKVCYYFPLSFREFVYLVDPDAAKIQAQPLVFLSHLQDLLHEYVLTSGFPYVINKYYQDNAIEDRSYDIYKDWIEGELTKSKRSVFYAHQIFSRLVESITSQVNWEGLAKSTTIRSHTTIAEYIDLFDSLFIAKVVPQLASNMKISFVKNKKIYFYDHFLFSVVEKNIFKILQYHEYFKEKIKNDPVYLSKIIENIVFSNLLKHLVVRGYGPDHVLFFWRGKTQLEVDFIVKVRTGTQKILIPIEVKYRNTVSPSPLKTFRPLILSKDTYDEKHSIYPVSLFLFELESFVKI